MPDLRNQNISFFIFKIGVFFLASAPSLSAILLIYPLLTGIKENYKNVFNDKLNFFLIIGSSLMILKSLYSSTFLTNTIEDWNYSLNWYGLANWLPLFLVYFGFQSYLKTNNQREITGKIFLLGTVPVIFSIFSHYYLGWYGPFEAFNGFIVWFQKPLTEINQPVSGLFNNPNYAGAWLAIIWPFSLALLKTFKLEKINLNYFLVFTYCILIILSLNLINSRGAWLGVIVSLPIMYGRKVLIWLGPLLLFFFSFLILIMTPNIPSLLQETLRFLIPDNILSNFTELNLSYENMPRLLIWKNSIKLIFQKPFFGWGAGSFPVIFLYQTGMWKGHPHNLFLELSISYGLLASTMIFSFVTILISNALNNFLDNKNLLKNQFERSWISASLISIILQSFDITYFDLRISITIWILFAGLRGIIYKEKLKVAENL